MNDFTRRATAGLHFLQDHIHNWHFDIPTLFITLLVAPVGLYLLAILRKHAKTWGGFLVEGVCYWSGRLIVHSLAARFTLRRYCRLQLLKENKYLYVPSRSDVKLEIDKVFVNLTLEEQSDSGESYDHDTLFSAGNRIRVIGDPGSGKSSLVKRVFRDACAAAVAKPSKAKLPILVELKNLSVPKTIASQNLGEWFYTYLRETTKKSDIYKIEECFDNYARVTGLLILLDGLDEVSTSAYERLQAAVVALSDKLANLNQNNLVVLTMRTQLHQQVRDSFRDTFGKALFVKPFTPTDVYEFLSRWPFGDRRMGTAIYTELTDRPTLREMCTNPLVLAMYVADRQSGSDPITPDSRTDFYKRVLEELLIKRRLRQIGIEPAVGKLREQRERILGKLAYDHILDPKQPANCLHWKEAIDIVKTLMSCNEQRAEEIFMEIARDTGLVTQERERESFRFIHLTFCEFLAAREAVEGQTDGFVRLIELHKRLQNNRSFRTSARLLEVIPFACGLVPRSRRQDAITEIAGLNDDQLLARCFLETKAYENPNWKAFADRTRNALLGARPPHWNENWLRDLHLFNVVVRDATQCSAHLPNLELQVDLGGFYEELVKRQEGGSLSTLLAAYASHDAPAAFRLAEVTGLDLPGDFPEVIVNNCDQTPFLSLVLAAMVADSTRLSVWAAPLSEAALGSRLVAWCLYDRPPERGAIEAYLRAIPARLRWDAPPIFAKSLYAQILSLATNPPPSTDTPGSSYKRLQIVSRATPPRGLRWRRFEFTLAMMLALLVLVVMVFFGANSGTMRLGGMMTHRGSISFALITVGTIFSYVLLFRMVATKLFYRTLLNLSGGLPGGLTFGAMGYIVRLLGGLVGHGQFVDLPFSILMTRTERSLLASMNNIGRREPIRALGD